MAQLAKHLLTHFICGLLLIGQIPGWWHVAHCDSDACLPVASENESCGCSCGISEHEIPSANASKESSVGAASRSNHGGHDHQSGHCILCRTVNAPSFACDFGDVEHHYFDLASDLCEAEAEAILSESHSLPRPRGPPLG